MQAGVLIERGGQPLRRERRRKTAARNKPEVTRPRRRDGATLGRVDQPLQDHLRRLAMFRRRAPERGSELLVGGCRKDRPLGEGVEKPGRGGEDEFERSCAHLDAVHCPKAGRRRERRERRAYGWPADAGRRPAAVDGRAASEATARSRDAVASPATRPSAARAKHGRRPASPAESGQFSAVMPFLCALRASAASASKALGQRDSGRVTARQRDSGCR